MTGWTGPTPTYGLCRGVCRVVTSVMFDLKTYADHHVPDRGGALIVANHESYLDPVVVAVQLRRPMSFMAKSELFAVPGFGPLIRRLGAFPVRQGRGDKAAIEETIARLREGHMLTIFPEGSRTEDGNLQPIQRGVALIVRRAQVPVIPAVVTGSFEAWPRGRTLPLARPVRVLYGPALALDGLKGDAIGQLVDRTFRAMLADLRARVRRERSASLYRAHDPAR